MAMLKCRVWNELGTYILYLDTILCVVSSSYLCNPTTMSIICMILDWCQYVQGVHLYWEFLLSWASKWPSSINLQEKKKCLQSIGYLLPASCRWPLVTFVMQNKKFKLKTILTTFFCYLSNCQTIKLCPTVGKL